MPVARRRLRRNTPANRRLPVDRIAWTKSLNLCRDRRTNPIKVDGRVAMGQEPGERILFRCGEVASWMGYGRVVFEIAAAIEKTGVPSAIWAGEVEEKYLALDSWVQDRLVYNPVDAWCLHVMPPTCVGPKKGRWAAFTMHEATGLPPGSADKLAGADVVIVPCRFNAEEFAAAGVDRDKIRVVPLGVNIDVFSPRVGIRPDGPLRFGIAGQSGKSGHCGQRKMVADGARAFLAAFPEDGPDAPVLEIKATHACEIDPPPHPRIWVIREGWSQDRLAEWLRSLDVFVVSSAGEGFGLWTLQALACGVPVVYAANTATVDFCDNSVGWPVACRRQPAGVCYEGQGDWFPPVFPSLVTAMLDAATDDEGRARRSIEAARRASGYTWDRTARGVLDALASAYFPIPGMEPKTQQTKVKSRSIVGRRPRIAISAPWHSKPNGVADYAARLATALSDRADVELIHDHRRPDDWPEHTPDLPKVPDDKVDPGRYDAASHHLGNNPVHVFQLPLLGKIPGCVTLHDVRLDGLGNFVGRSEDELLASVCRDARRIVVHANCNVGMLPEAYRGKAEVVPFGADVAQLDAETRKAVRLREGLPVDSWLVGSGGFLHPGKGHADLIYAFSTALTMGGIHPDSYLVLVGPDLDGWCAKTRKAVAHPERILLLPEMPTARFAEVMASLDTGVVLRRPPTRGETSATLMDFLRAGVPTIVTDVGSFAEFPDDAVAKVSWDGDAGGRFRGVEGLSLALGHLAADPDEAKMVGESGLRLVKLKHSWPFVAGKYLRALGLECGCGGMA